MSVSEPIQTLINRNALFVVNHSGGKDSQAMLAELRRFVPAAQLVVVHAPLDGVEWDGTLDHVYADAADLPVILAPAVKTFVEMVEHRGMFPSPQQRQCTSDLKRGPIDREIRRYLKSHPEHNGLVVSCMGLRAGESDARAKAEPFKLNKRNSVAGREWYDWLPIHDMHWIEVVTTIAQESPIDLHWAYQAGMSRLSCQFCIMSSTADKITAAILAPEAYDEMVALERRVGHTIDMTGKGLEEVTGIKAGTRNHGEAIDLVALAA